MFEHATVKATDDGLARRTLLHDELDMRVGSSEVLGVVEDEASEICGRGPDVAVFEHHFSNLGDEGDMAVGWPRERRGLADSRQRWYSRHGRATAATSWGSWKASVAERRSGCGGVRKVAQTEPSLVVRKAERDTQRATQTRDPTDDATSNPVIRPPSRRARRRPPSATALDVGALALSPFQTRNGALLFVLVPQFRR